MSKELGVQLSGRALGYMLEGPRFDLQHQKRKGGREGEREGGRERKKKRNPTFLVRMHESVAHSP